MKQAQQTQLHILKLTVFQQHNQTMKFLKKQITFQGGNQKI